MHREVSKRENFRVAEKKEDKKEKCVTWEGAGWRWGWHGDGHPDTAAPAVFPTATSAAGMAASAAPAAEHNTQLLTHHTCH